MDLDAEQIVGALLQHPNELVRMATENVILQAQIAKLTEARYGDIGLDIPDEGGAEVESEGEDS